MHHSRLAAAVLLSLAGLAALLAAAEPIPAPVAPPALAKQPAAVQEAPELSHNETRMIAAINRYRAGFRLPPLVANRKLMACARQRAARMNPRNAHCPGGVWPATAVKRAGYRYSACAENFAWTFTTPESAVRGWSLSPGHARAMRGPYADVGVGWHGNSSVAIFGKEAKR